MIKKMFKALMLISAVTFVLLQWTDRNIVGLVEPNTIAAATILGLSVVLASVSVWSRGVLPIGPIFYVVLVISSVVSWFASFIVQQVSESANFIDDRIFDTTISIGIISTLLVTILIDRLITVFKSMKE